MEWLLQRLPTILICLGLAVLVAAIIIHLVREKKRGKSSCGGCCAGCPMGGACHKH